MTIINDSAQNKELRALDGWTGINNPEHEVTPYGSHLLPLDF